METDNEYIEQEGTKSDVVDTVMQVCELDREMSELCLDFIKRNHGILSDDELFQYSKLEEQEVRGVSEFVSEEGKYYICLKKSTILLAVLYMENRYPALKKTGRVAGFFGMTVTGKGFLKLDENMGQLCIMLELARRRRRGADRNMLEGFGGECCNNQLGCHYNDCGRCSCSAGQVEEICEYFKENGIVKKKGKKYYYIF